MEVEHLVPRYLTGAMLDEVKLLHGLSDDYDVEALENLAPSCTHCNDVKGKRTPPNAPIIAMLLEKARERASKARKRAERAIHTTDVEKAIIVIASANPDRIDLNDDF